MKPLSYVLCYACLMHYLAYSGKIEGGRHVPLGWFIFSIIAGYLITIALIQESKKD